MIVQVYKNKEEGRIMFLSKAYQHRIKLYEGYEFVEEFEAESWDECMKTINNKFFNYVKQN